MRPTTVGDALLASARLALLRTLQASPDYVLNSSVLQDYLELCGFVWTRDRVEVECAWLAAAGLAETDTVLDGAILRVRLTRKALDLLAGRLSVEGIKRPYPTHSISL